MAVMVGNSKNLIKTIQVNCVVKQLLTYVSSLKNGLSLMTFNLLYLI